MNCFLRLLSIYSHKTLSSSKVRVYIESNERIISFWREIWWSYDRYESNLCASFLLNISANSWYSSRIKERSEFEIILLKLSIAVELVSMSRDMLMVYNWASSWFDAIANAVASMSAIIDDLYFVFSFWALIFMFSFWMLVFVLSFWVFDFLFIRFYAHWIWWFRLHLDFVMLALALIRGLLRILLCLVDEIELKIVEMIYSKM